MPGSGRKKGTPNKATAEIKARAREILEHPEVQATTLEMAIEGRLPPQIWTMLHHYAYGVPRQEHGVDLKGEMQVDNSIPDDALARQIEKILAESNP